MSKTSEFSYLFRYIRGARQVLDEMHYFVRIPFKITFLIFSDYALSTISLLSSPLTRMMPHLPLPTTKPFVIYLPPSNPHSTNGVAQIWMLDRCLFRCKLSNKLLEACLFYH